ncbi:MAG: helix-turn-helix domain-containing protein [Saprospiraceae bacterium]
MLVSERQLYRIIKDKMGVTPREYLNHLRFQKAYTYLTEGTYKTIRETANAVGFRDTVYFSRQFKNRFGILPSEVT